MLRELLVSDILIRFCERLPYAFIIVGQWTRRRNGRHFVIVWFDDLAMFCYIPVAHLADKYGRRPFVLITFVFFTLFPVTLLFAHSFKWLALAFVVRGLKEFGEPARKALIIGEATPELRAHLRRVLSHPRLHRHDRLVSRRVAVAYKPTGQFHRRSRSAAGWGRFGFGGLFI